MIRIRYRDSNEFSPGLHAAAERHGRTTMVYLLSGLTAPQRRSALRRLRLSARMGHCPRLPAAQLALALLADLIRTAVGRAGAVFRLHPAGSTVPVMVLSGGAIAFLLFSTVSIRVLPTPRTDTRSSVSGTRPAAPAGAIPISGVSHGLAAGPGGPGPGPDSRPLTQPGSGGLGGSSLARPPSPAGPGGSADPTLASVPTSGPAAASRTPAPAPAEATSPRGAAASSSSAPKPAPSRTTQGSIAVCVNVGPLGACLNI
jgi:hypothetical protein